MSTALVSFIAVLAALYIGLMQWRTAHYRLSLDMFDKRFKVYEGVKNITTTVIKHGIVIQKDLDELYENTRGAEFLFDGETRDFITNIRFKALTASDARARRQRSDNDKPNDEEENSLSFIQEQDSRLDDLFKPYLDLSKAGLKSYWPW
jgi:hypothetical protein